MPLTREEIVELKGLELPVIKCSMLIISTFTKEENHPRILVLPNNKINNSWKMEMKMTFGIRLLRWQMKESTLDMETQVLTREEETEKGQENFDSE